jgi:hypothetical protein
MRAGESRRPAAAFWHQAAGGRAVRAAHARTTRFRLTAARPPGSSRRPRPPLLGLVLLDDPRQFGLHGCLDPLQFGALPLEFGREALGLGRELLLALGQGPALGRVPGVPRLPLHAQALPLGLGLPPDLEVDRKSVV